MRRNHSGGIKGVSRHLTDNTMKIRLIIGGAIAGLAIMVGIAPGEKLSLADGKVSATTLPLDVKTAKVKFETATFGIG